MPVKMDGATRRAIIDFLSPHMDAEHRKQVIEDAFFGEAILNQIDTSGNPGNFTGHLVTTAYRYTTLSSGTHALIALLETVGNSKGDALHTEAIQLIKRLDASYEPKNQPEPSENQTEAKAPPKIFISYKREYEDFVRWIAEKLSNKGAQIWMDITGIPVGMKWSNAIQEGLKECEVMLLVVTPEAIASKNVEDEWNYFHSRDKLIIPLYRKTVDKDEMPFQLDRLQRVDFRYDRDAGYMRLEEALKEKGLLS